MIHYLGDLCAAKFLDGQWYRGKVLKTSATEATILYIDYGNRGKYYEFEFCLENVYWKRFFYKKSLFFDEEIYIVSYFIFQKPFPKQNVQLSHRRSLVFQASPKNMGWPF